MLVIWNKIWFYDHVDININSLLVIRIICKGHIDTRKGNSWKSVVFTCYLNVYVLQSHSIMFTEKFNLSRKIYNVHILNVCSNNACVVVYFWTKTLKVHSLLQ